MGDFTDLLYHPARLALLGPPEWPLEAALRRRVSPTRAEALERWLVSGRSPAFLIESEPVGEAPSGWWPLSLQRGRPPALPLLASKLGGRPYLERAADWPTGYRFLGQIDFGALPERLPHLPRRGLLSLFLGELSDFEPVRAHWYEAPHESKATPPPKDLRSAVRIESRLHFRPIWIPPETLDGRAHPSPEDEPELAEQVLAWTGQILLEQGVRPGTHLLGPPLLTALTDQFRPDELAHLATVLRLESDPQAGLSLGDRLLYILGARQDLEEGRLARCLPVWSSY
jgi:hypothetical protein